MSGNYDFPPASRRTARGIRPSDRSNRPNINNQLQHLRDLLNSEPDRTVSARALETLDQEIDEFRAGRARDRTAFDQTRAFVDQQLRELQAEIQRESRARGGRLGSERPWDSDIRSMNHNINPSDISRSVNRAPRSRAVRVGDRPGRGWRRSRESNLPSTLDQPIPRFESPSVMPPEPDRDSQMDRWRAKRRKLDSDDNREGLQSFRYGQYGQVVPGALKMELASCDGGTYEPEGESSWPENILRNDSSVYCTKTDRCNLILKHHGETPFCLQKLVIKAPKSGYDAPIQAGMVFVSMASDEVLARTAQYHIQYSGSRQHRGHRRSGMPPSQQYMNFSRTPLQTLERATLAGIDSDSDLDSDTGESSEPSSSNVAEPTAEFRVTTEYDERSDGGDDDRPRDNISAARPSTTQGLERMATLYPTDDDSLCSESEDSVSDDDDTSESASFNSRRQELQRRVRAMRRQYAMEQEERSRRRRIPATIPPPSVLPAPHAGSSTRPSNVGLLKPLAEFFIKRPKSSVSLKFDPPPSGRYILIKLWSPYNAGNIDIQSIVAHGFAGPRFFPAVDPR